jgi:tetratricopeptide (TPR) repeat protein
MLENIGQIEAKKGDWEKAIGCYDAALNICQEIDATYHEATTLNNLGTIYLEQGDLPNAISSFTKSAEKHQSVNNPKGQSLALSNLGSAYVDQGAYDLADQCYQNSLLISKSFGDRSREARTYNNLGALAEKTARYKEALAHYEKSMLVFLELEEFYRAIVAIINICSLHNRLSSPHKCMHFLEQGLELAKKEEYYDHAFTLSIIRGDALFIQGSEFYPLAFEWYGQASRYASMLPFISLETFIKTIQARIAYLESAKEANNDLELLLEILVKTWGDSTLSKRELDFFEYLSQKALPPTPN